VSDLVSRQTGFRPTDVKCPSGIDAKAGVTFTCNFTGPEGRRYTAYMRVIDVHGARVNFYIQTRPDRLGLATSAAALRTQRKG
jgi:hypothetical protein